MKPKVLITEHIHQSIIPLLTEIGYDVIVKEGIAREQLLMEIQDYYGIIVSTRTKVDPMVIDHATQLKFVGRVGSGMEQIDVDSCAVRGIRCYSSPEGNAPAVGEHCLGMLLSLVRNMKKSHEELLKGIWQRQENTGIELEGRTVGIIGFGHTGSAFVKKLQGFNMRVLVFDPYKTIMINEVQQVSLETIQQEAEIISFHVPYNQKTHYYLNESFIENCRKTPIFINTSRGAVMDFSAVERGLNSGKISGLCVDVYEDEPISKATFHPFELYKRVLSRENVIATSHIAGWTWEAKERMVKILVAKIRKSS